MQPGFPCEFCGLDVDVNAKGSFKRVIGWVQNKGSASPALMSSPTGWAHYGCIEIEKREPIKRQSQSLF